MPAPAVMVIDLSPLKSAKDRKVVKDVPSSNGPGGVGATVRSPVACASSRFEKSAAPIVMFPSGEASAPALSTIALPSLNADDAGV